MLFFLSQRRRRLSTTHWLRASAGLLVSVVALILSTPAGADQVLNNNARSYSSVQEHDSVVEGSPCALWLAPSTLVEEKLGLYSGLNVMEGDVVGRDIHIPLIDANMNEQSPWHEALWKAETVETLLLATLFEVSAFLPGLGTLLRCYEGYGNVISYKYETVDSLGVHRSKDPAAGSFSYRHEFEFVAAQQINEGQELVFPCGLWDPDTADQIKPSPTRSFDWLQENDAICLDTILVRPSTVAPGRGAFSKFSVEEGETVTSSPVALVHRAQLEIVEQYETSNDETFVSRGKVKYTENVRSMQLSLNYAYGRADSNILLLPMGPGVNFINHSQEPNVQIRWSESPLSDEGVLDLNAFEAVEEGNVKVLVDYVALRDIEAGEELLMDYGADWEAAWEEHVEKWSPPEGSENYISAADYKRQYGEQLLTVEEQRENPYPENIITACYFLCMRPCSLEERIVEEGEIFYYVWMHEIPNLLSPKDCDLPEGVKEETQRLSAELIYLVDDAYTDDQHLNNGFRHVIGVDIPYPTGWMARDPNPLGDFLLPSLQPGEIVPIRWAKNGEIVVPNAHLLGLPSKVRLDLLNYCNRMGITEKFLDLTVRGNSLQPHQEEKIVLHGFNWFAQRPGDHWTSNLSWISPFDEEANTDYLMALSSAGFDFILSSIGTHFGLKGLACYHITFIALTVSKRGHLHYDLTGTDSRKDASRGFNIIIPLLLADETGPELDVQAEDDEVGRLKYQYDVAVLMGDDAFHASSATDYRGIKQMRMAATVYVADIDTENIEKIMNDYTQYYPPSDRPDLLLAMAGTHWNANNPEAKLPRPNKAFEALSLRYEHDN